MKDNDMKKETFGPGAMLNPVPAVMVSCGSGAKDCNIITIAWTGIVNSDPPLTYISVRPERHSHKIISETEEFVINLCTEETAFAADYCGVKSGRDVDKFKEQKLTPVKAELVKAPMIGECPVNIECRVKEVRSYPTHDMFVAEILKVHADRRLVDKGGRIRLDLAKLICYNHGEYFGLKQQPLGRFGYSVMKAKTKKRIAAEKRRAAVKKNIRKDTGDRFAAAKRKKT